MRARRVLLTGVCLAAALAAAWRIRTVNQSELLKKYLPQQVIREAGEQIALSEATYYVDQADLSGYHMEITGTEVVRTEDFLQQYGRSMQDLELLSIEAGDTYEQYGLLYLVTASFWNDGWETPSEDFVMLDNFLLVGTDFYEIPATRSVHQIPGFNPELGGAAAFAIGSDRVFEVTIPYLICTEGERRITEEELLNSDLRLLITVYPQECYLKLPEPQ